MQEKDKELILKIKTEFDDTKKSFLIEELLNIYMPTIKETVSKINQEELEAEDLIQEGYLAFLKAIENYDLNKKVSFEDFLKRSIESKIKDSIEEYKNTKSIPEYIINELNNLMDYEKEYLEKNNSDPTIKDIAEYMNQTEDGIKELKEYALRALNISSTNINIPLFKLVNEIKDDDVLEEMDKEQILKESLDSLSEVEKNVISMFYGLDNNTKKTMQQISKELEISIEKVRQIINLSKIKLKREMEDTYEN